MAKFAVLMNVVTPGELLILKQNYQIMTRNSSQYQQRVKSLQERAYH